MTNAKNTKRALLTSVMALILCMSMLVGTTFAWFTDEVTSTNNIIQTGTLDAALYYGDTADDITKDASQGVIFDYQHWEPGYTQTKYVRIANEGTLAFKFRLNIVPNVQVAAGEFNLADVIDVYLFDVNATIDRDVIAAATPVGTLSSLMADPDGAAYGYLLPTEDKDNDKYNTAVEAPRGEIAYCIVLKMQESATNDYQNLTVGEGFSVQLLATQYTWEEDSFNHNYDEGAEFDEAPKANVINTGAKWVRAADAGNWNDRSLDKDMYLATSFQFQPTETLEQAEASEYKYYHVDYVVYADKDIAGNTIALAGFYKAFADFLGRDVWIPMESAETITAGTEIRLVELLGVTVNYEEICRWGNDGTGFLCGINAAVDADNKALAAGTTITVELRMYEVPAQGDCSVGGGCTHPSKECETGNYTILGTYTFTVPTEIVPTTNP